MIEVHQQIAWLVERSAFLKDSPGLRILRQAPGAAEPLRAKVGNPIAFGRQPDRRLEQFLPGPGSEFLVRQFEPADIAGHGGGAPARHRIR